MKMALTASNYLRVAFTVRMACRAVVRGFEIAGLMMEQIHIFPIMTADAERQQRLGG